MIARLNGGDIATNFLHNPSAVMAQDRWGWRKREIPIYDGQITVTHSACRYFNQNLLCLGLSIWISSSLSGVFCS